MPSRRATHQRQIQEKQGQGERLTPPISVNRIPIPFVMLIVKLNMTTAIAIVNTCLQFAATVIVNGFPPHNKSAPHPTPKQQKILPGTHTGLLVRRKTNDIQPKSNHPIQQ